MGIAVSSEKFDKPLLIITMILIAIGTVMVFSSSSDISLDKFGSGTFYFRRHILRVLMGLMAMVVAMFIDFRIWNRIAAPLFIATVLLLLVTVVVFQLQGNDSPARWLYVGSLPVQTSDLARFATILYLASYLNRKRDAIGRSKITACGWLNISGTDGSPSQQKSIIGNTLAY